MRPLTERRVRAMFAAALVLGLSGGGVLASTGTAGALTQKTLYVSASASATTGCTSSTVCKTIQDAVTVAETLNTATEAVTIHVAAGTYTGTSTPIVTIDIDLPTSKLHSLTIEGAGASSTTVTGASEGYPAYEDFKVRSGTVTTGSTVTRGTVTISGLSIDDGHATRGGGLYSSAKLHLLHDVITADTATTGGGVYIATEPASVDFTSDLVSGDDARNGGGFYVLGGLSVADTTISGDTATTDGGGGFEDGPVTDADPSNTYSDDHARFGGGVYITVAVAGAANDTFFADTATEGGAIYNAGTSTLTDDTLSQDTAATQGGGVYNVGVVVANATIFDGSSCVNSGESTHSGAYDVSTTTTGCTFTTSVTTTMSRIGLTTTLRPNGSTGPTTLALLPTSPAIDEVPSSACTVTTDERGDPRPGNTTPTHHQTSCDAGAYEWQHSFVVLDQGPPETGRVGRGTSATFQLAVTNQPPNSGVLSFLATAGTVPTGVRVSPSGEIAVSGGTPGGTYTLAGSDADASHDSGAWTFRLTVGGTPFTITVNGQSTPVSAVYGSTATFAEAGLPSGARGSITFEATGTTVCTATLPAKTCSVDLILAGSSTPYTITGTFNSSSTRTYPSSTSTNAVQLTVTPAQTEVTCTARKTCTATATDNTEPGTTATVTAAPGAKTVVSVNFGTTKYPLYGCTGTTANDVPYIVNWTSGSRLTTLTYTQSDAYETANSPFSFFTFCYGSFLRFRAGGDKQAKFDAKNHEYEGTLPLCIVADKGPCILFELKSGTSQIYEVLSGPGGAPKGGPNG